MLHHVSIEIPPDEVDKSVEFWGQRLRDAGFQVEDTRQLWGADRAFAIAPGGHRVELMAEPPPRSN
jgi:hypothetical protein